MSWHYSRVLVEAFSGASCSGGERCALSKSTPIVEPPSRSGKTTGLSRRSLSGTMFARLTDTHGAELLTWFREGSRVRTSVWPERAKDWTGSAAGSGRSLQGSLARWDRSGCLWRIPQRSLLEGLDVFSGTWPVWGMMRSGVCWERSMPVRRIGGTGFGLWPTPTVDGNYNRKGASANSGDGLATAVMMWPTPCAMEPHKDLEAFHAKRALARDQRGGGHGPNLATMVQMMPTPTASDNKRGDRMEHWLNNPKAGQRRGQLTDPDMGVIQPGGQLNPPWVEWLMGWPIGWTDLERLEMDRFRRWPQWHSES